MQNSSNLALMLVGTVCFVFVRGCMVVLSLFVGWCVCFRVCVWSCACVCWYVRAYLDPAHSLLGLHHADVLGGVSLRQQLGGAQVVCSEDDPVYQVLWLTGTWDWWKRESKWLTGVAPIWVSSHWPSNLDFRGKTYLSTVQMACCEGALTLSLSEPPATHFGRLYRNLVLSVMAHPSWP